MAEKPVTALEIDASGVLRAAQEVEGATRRIVAANDAAMKSTDALSDASTAAVPAAEGLRKAVDNVSGKLERLRATADPAYKSLKQLEQAENLYAAAVRQGLASQEEAARNLDALWQKAERAANSQTMLATTAQAAYRQLMAALDPAAAEQARYAEEVRKATTIMDAANVSEQERTRALTLLANAYDPVTIATNKRTAAINAEMEALERSIALAREEVQARQAQANFNQNLGVADTPRRSARDSASAFTEAFEEEDRVRRAVEENAKAEEDRAKALEASRMQYDPLYAAQRRYERQIEEINELLRRGAISEQTAMEARQRAQQQMESGGSSGVTAFKSVGQAAQQAGYQIGDFAIQVAGGQNVLVAFAQQGSQIAGFFGPGGAIAGAALAIAAAAANLFIFSGGMAAAARKQDELTGAFNRWNTAVGDAARTQERFQSVLDRVAEIQDKLKGATDRSAEAIAAETRNTMAAAAMRVKDAQAALVRAKAIAEMAALSGAADAGGAGGGQPYIDAIKRVEALQKALNGVRTELGEIKYGAGVELDLLRAAAGELPGERGARLANDNSSAGKGATTAEDELTAAKERAQKALSALNQSLQFSNAVLEDAIERQRQGAEVTENNRTAWERWADEQDRLNKLLATGAINAETFGRAMEAANPVTSMLAMLPDLINLDSVAATAATISKEFEKQIQLDMNASLEKGKISDAFAKFESELDKRAQAAGDALGNVFTRIEAGDWTAVAEGIGIFQDRMRAVEDEALTASDAITAVGQALWDSAEFANGAMNMLGDMLGRSSAQRKNANKGAAAGATIAQLTGLPKGPLTAIGNIIGGLFGMSKADERAARLAAEVVEFSKVANDFVRAGAPLSQFGGELEALDLKFANLKAEAIRLKQPVDALTASYEKQRAKLIASFGADIQDVIDRLTGNDLAVQLRALQKAQDQRMQDALRAEYDLGQVRIASALELSDLYSRFTADQLAAMGSLVGRLDMVKARIRDLTGTLSTQIDSQIDMAQELANASRQQASSLRALASSLRDSIFANLTGDLSPLSPFDRFATLETEFNRLTGLAKAGDQDAGNRLDDVGGQLLEAAKQLYASAPEYVAIFNRVQAALAQVAMGADVRATGFDRLADVADVQVEILGDIRDLLSTDLAANLGNAISAAIADGTLTVGEVAGIDSLMDDLTARFGEIGGTQAQAVRTALESLSPMLTAGALSPEQKAALTTGQGQITAALNSFRSTQLEEYRQALIASGGAIAALQTFVLDPNGRIPAAIEAAFNGAGFNQTLTGRIENLFRTALGDTVIPLPLSGRVYDLFGRAIGDTAMIGNNMTTRVGVVLGQAIGDPTAFGQNLAVRADSTLTTAVGTWSQQDLAGRADGALTTAVGTWSQQDLAGRADGTLTTAVGTWSQQDLAGRADSTFATAIGAWSQQNLAARIVGQFGQAVGTWGETPLTDRINEIFTRAIGAADGETFQGALKSVLDGQSPIVQGLSQLSIHVQGLTAAMAADASNAAGQQAYDRALQGFVSPVVQAATSAQQTLSTIPFDDRSGSHNNRTNLNVDATSGGTSWAGGNKENDSSRARAAQLASGLSGIARQLEVLSGGDLSSFQIQAAEQNSGYSIGAINRLSTFGGNDFEAITRAFVTDAISSISGGNAAALDILRNTDFTNLVAGMTKAASDIYKAMNPVMAAASTAPANSNNRGGAYNEGAYLAANPDVAAAVAAGWFGSGMDHWLAYGQGEAAAGLRVPGFADGGVVTGGVPGRDSALIVATPGERVLTEDQDAKLDRIYDAVKAGAMASRPDNVFPAEAVSVLREIKAAMGALTAETKEWRREQAQQEERSGGMWRQMLDNLRAAAGQAGGWRP